MHVRSQDISKQNFKIKKGGIHARFPDMAANTWLPSKSWRRDVPWKQDSPDQISNFFVLVLCVFETHTSYGYDRLCVVYNTFLFLKWQHQCQTQPSKRHFWYAVSHYNSCKSIYRSNFWSKIASYICLQHFHHEKMRGHHARFFHGIAFFNPTPIFEPENCFYIG